MRASDLETEPDFQVRSEVDPTADVLTQLQQRLHEISMQMMTYVGVLQRDAPAIYREVDPASGGVSGAVGMVKVEASPASPRSNDTRFVQNILLERATSQAKAFASDIVTTSKRIDLLIADIGTDIEAKAGKEDELLREAVEARARARERYYSVLATAESKLGKVKLASLALDQTETRAETEAPASARDGSEPDDELVEDDFATTDKDVISPRTQELNLDEEDDMDVDSFL